MPIPIKKPTGACITKPTEITTKIPNRVFSDFTSTIGIYFYKITNFFEFSNKYFILIYIFFIFEISPKCQTQIRKPQTR